MRKGERPLLSVVIANYNYGRFLKDAINSVISQGMGEKVELIICDGGSTDDSARIITDYHDNITWWCSEKDGGQSAAFNKGFSHARGRFLTWLNADDVFLQGTLKRFEQAVAANPLGEWFGGGCFFLDPELRIYKCARGRRVSPYRICHGMVGVTGPSSFFSRGLYDRVGKVDERFKYTMDTDLWLRFAVIERAKYIPFARYIWGLRLHRGAKMSGHKFTVGGEILEGAESRKAFERDAERLEQIRKEERWMREKVTGLIAPPSRLGALLSADVCPAILSRLDTWWFRGRDYMSVCKAF